ncbi:hypothetical protein DFR50_12117 [Roseiarcus fermentans]|uniref:Uncharacterized protein n=1 Tax=Roseiarcus fermentans TaxID=1473586 RepID=A0A366F4U0_9HYPH|nr:hypothetical protein [Roseiarcus fermentans]RBP09673.1 hypothetical protein DFR50_12117 [Roseiarcus fermentans]
MAEIPLSWRAYAAHQSNLNSRMSVDATSWGVEAGLNHLLEGGNLDTPPDDVDRVVASAARRSRYSKSLLAKYIIVGDEVRDDSSYLEARSSLAALRRSIPSASLDLLVDLAAGFEFLDLAAKHGATTGALRTRAARARQTARAIAC